MCQYQTCLKEKIMNKILFLFVFISSIVLGDISFQDVTYNIQTQAPEMPDENSSKIEMKSSAPFVAKYKTLNMDSDETMKMVMNSDGTRSLQNSETNSTGYMRMSVPEKCVDTSSSKPDLIDVQISAYSLVIEDGEKRVAMGLPKATTEAIRLQNHSQMKNTKCVKVTLAGKSESIYNCGDCAKAFMPSLSRKTQTSDGKEVYIPDNARLKTFYQYDGKNNKSMALLQTMQQNNQIGKRINIQSPNVFDPSQIPEDLKDSREANITKRAAALQESLFITQVRQKVTKCFMRRELVPQYFCPIPGLNFGARTGGNPEDDQVKAKKECDSFCESQSYGCRSADTGYEKNVAISQKAEFSFSGGVQESQDVSFALNNRLEVKDIQYSINIEYTDVNQTNTGLYFKSSDASIYIRADIKYRQEGKSSYSHLSGPAVFKLDSSNVIKIPQMPSAQDIVITFYQPYMHRNGIFVDMNIEDIVSKVTVDNFKIEYTDNKYYFCSLDQVILDPTTQCLNGEAYELRDGSGSFIICKSDLKIQGPEKEFGGFYTQESCTASCSIKKQCVKSYSGYRGDPTSNSAYKVTVGCIDDPFNVICSQEMCEDMFRDSTMPVEEWVYDSVRNKRKTVSAGVEIFGESRPKINLDAELAAANATDVDAAYKAVFLDEMKDQAYQNMLNRRTYDYIKVKSGENAPFEYAYREEDSVVFKDAFYTGTFSDKNIYWKLKPASFDIKTGDEYYIYKIIKSEQIFKPISGAFMENNDLTDQTITYTPQRSYKDFVYSYVTNAGNVPFYIKEYAQVYIDRDANTTGSSGWIDNSQHNASKFINYDPINDKYAVSSNSQVASFVSKMEFKGDKNYEEIYFLDSPFRYLMQEQDGGVIQSQSTTHAGSLPVKHYSITSKGDGTNGSIVNYHLYGIYSPTQLTNQEIIDMLTVERQDKYLIYRATKGSNNKKEINGDGYIGKQKFKMFIKGKPGSTTLTVDVVPRLEEEAKNVVFFMYMFEGELK